MNIRSVKRIDLRQNSFDEDKINEQYRYICVEDIHWEGNVFCKLTKIRVIGISLYPSSR